MPRYTVLPYPEAGASSVLVPALPGCATQDDRVDEALAMAHDAIMLHLEGLVEDGEDVPDEEMPPMVVTVEVPTPRLQPATR